MSPIEVRVVTVEELKRALTDVRAVMDLASIACDGDHRRAIYALIAAAIAFSCDRADAAYMLDVGSQAIEIARGKLVVQAAAPESVLRS